MLEDISRLSLLEQDWLRLCVGPEVPGLHHHVEEGGGGEGDGEVELAIEGGHLAPGHQPPVRVLDQHMSIVLGVWKYLKY